MAIMKLVLEWGDSEQDSSDSYKDRRVGTRHVHKIAKRKYDWILLYILISMIDQEGMRLERSLSIIYNISMQV